MIYVYIAGPYSQPDPVLNVRAAISAGEQLYAAGLCPYIPHMSMFHHLLYPQPIEVWYQRDLHWLSRCDVLLRIQESVPSYGADHIEIPQARQLGMLIWFNIDLLIDAHNHGEVIRRVAAVKP